MSKVLFVCKGNVGRSQMAEAFYSHLVGRGAYSAGIKAVTELVHPPEDVVDIMLEENIDLSNQIIKKLNEDMVRKADKVIIMCKKEIYPSYLNNYSNKVLYWNIKDPRYMNTDERRKIRDIIKEKVLSLNRKS
ncbi:MAG: arsenate reductase ArsC [Candidatus Pacearchaeota archaeon]|nr:MAG: arsenate reductase ArsC [Candidatus Pacearchaeota archaeon]